MIDQPINGPHQYTRNLIYLGHYGWPLLAEKNITKSLDGKYHILGNNNSGASLKGYLKTDLPMPKKQADRVNATAPIRSIVPRELNNMAYYDDDYSGWIAHNVTYQGTQAASKRLRPFLGENSGSHTIYDKSTGTHADATYNWHERFTTAGCTKYNHVWNPFLWTPTHDFIGKAVTGHGENPKIEGDGTDEKNLISRYFKMNGKYSNCKWHGSWMNVQDKDLK